MKEDPFAIMRSAATASPITVSTNTFINDIERQIQIYENTSYGLPEDNNPLILWCDQQSFNNSIQNSKIRFCYTSVLI
jgi:hypothetical protein